jgi:hypothetical protein
MDQPVALGSCNRPNTGSLPAQPRRIAAAVPAAKQTGMKERPRYSKSSSSIASSTADTGEPKVAAMPAAAPAASSVLRSVGLVCSTCPSTDPKEAPDAMMGPSAPKGPPVPIEMAAESGLRTVMRTGIRLW